MLPLELITCSSLLTEEVKLNFCEKTVFDIPVLITDSFYTVHNVPGIAMPA